MTLTVERISASYPIDPSGYWDVYRTDREALCLLNVRGAYVSMKMLSTYSGAREITELLSGLNFAPNEYTEKVKISNHLLPRTNPLMETAGFLVQTVPLLKHIATKSSASFLTFVPHDGGMALCLRNAAGSGPLRQLGATLFTVAGGSFTDSPRIPTYPLPYTTNVLDYTVAEAYTEEEEGDQLLRADDPLIGVELETSWTKSSELNEFFNDFAKKNQPAEFIVKRDGSIRRVGGEVVTRPMRRKNQVAFFNKLLATIPVNVSSGARSNCGMHVHVDRKALTPLLITKLVTFTGLPSNRKFLGFMAGRTDSSYARFRRSLYSQQDSVKVVSGAKYNMLNLGKKETIEFRLFTGSLCKEEVAARIEFVCALVDFCKKVNRYRLGAGDFIAWLGRYKNKRDKYPALIKYLGNRYTTGTDFEKTLKNFVRRGLVAPPSSQKEIRARKRLPYLIAKGELNGALPAVRSVYSIRKNNSKLQAMCDEYGVMDTACVSGGKVDTATFLESNSNPSKLARMTRKGFKEFMSRALDCDKYRVHSVDLCGAPFSAEIAREVVRRRLGLPDYTFKCARLPAALRKGVFGVAGMLRTDVYGVDVETTKCATLASLSYTVDRASKTIIETVKR